VTLRPFDGGWYAGARPDGSYVVLIRDSHFETSEGRVPLSPVGNVLELVTGPQRRFAGHGHNDVNVWEWDGSWQNRGVGEGQNCCLYDANGKLQIIRETDGAPTGSQGWRYRDPDTGRLVPSDERPLAFGLTQPVSLGRGIWIGQGHDGGGVKVWDGAHLRILASGACYAIRAEVAGEQIGLAFYEVLGGDRTRAFVGFPTFAELLALPLDVPTPPPPPTTNPEPPTPEPIPVPDIAEHKDVFVNAVLAHPDLLAQLRAIAAAGDADGWTPDQQSAHAAVRATLLRVGAWAVYQIDPNYGLLKKESGTLGTRADGTKHAVQILMHKSGRLVHVLSDTGPEWSPLPETDTRAADFWIQPLPEGDSVPPVVDPPGTPLPPEAPPEATSLDAIVRGLIAAAVAPLRAELDALKARPQPSGSFPSRIALRTDNGNYLCAEDGGGLAVNATRYAVGSWETFTVEPQP
jgi:hypothetical protein